MLPTITQRLLMTAAIILGTVCWLPILPMLRVADGWTGLSLMDARAGVLFGCLLLLVAGLPALLSGLYVSSSGNPLSGIFTVGFALLIMAGQGGSMQGLIWRQAERPDGAPKGGAIFMQLELELALWALAWCLLLFLIRRFRGRIREALVPKRLKTPFDPQQTEEDTPRFILQVRPIVSGVLCGALAWIICRFLMHSADNGQVIGTILLAFTVAALTARLALPTGNVVYLLLSPLAVGFASYAHAAVLHGHASAQDLIMLWQRGQVLGPALAMPIHWASAGLIGVSAGIGMAQAIDRVRTVVTEQTDDSDPETPGHPA